MLMSELPLDPPLAKALLTSAALGCSQEAATIASMLSVRSIWMTIRGEIKALERAKNRFAVRDLNPVAIVR